MKVAVTLFGDRVSPRFDAAPQVLIVDTAQRSDAQPHLTDLTGESGLQRVNTLRNLRVDAVICGAIDQESSWLLTAAGIQLYCWVTGMAEEALRLLEEGRLTSGLILRGPGKRPQRWRFRGGWGHRNRNGQNTGTYVDFDGNRNA